MPAFFYLTYAILGVYALVGVGFTIRLAVAQVRAGVAGRERLNGPPPSAI